MEFFLPPLHVENYRSRVRNACIRAYSPGMGGAYRAISGFSDFSRLCVQVDLDYRGMNQWQRCFVEPGVHLPTGMHLGFSAITGALSGTVGIIIMCVICAYRYVERFGGGRSAR